MNRPILICLPLLILLMLAGCVSSPAGETKTGITDIDTLVATAAAETVALLSDSEERTLAVYYFTAAGEQSPLSDYIIGALSIEIANRVKKLGLGINIVSRQNLDQLINELQFQVSSLVDEKTQLSLGKQLGADIILSGTITPVSGFYKLNAQLLEVETGVVLGGYTLDFTIEKDFEEKILSEKSGVSEVYKIDEKIAEHGGIAITTSLFETFDGSVLSVPLTPHTDYYGAGILSVSDKLILEPGAGIANTTAAMWKMKAEFSARPGSPGWEDAYLDYYLKITPKDWKTKDFDGLALSLKPLGFNALYINLVQYDKEEERIDFAVQLTLNENQWQDLVIPFYNFYNYEGRQLNPDLPFFIELDISCEENYHKFFFREGDTTEAALLLDNLGLFKMKDREDRALLESFNDEISRMLIYVNLYNVSGYMAYELVEGLDEETAQGIDIYREVPGISDLRFTFQKEENGPDGRFLEIRAEMAIGEELQAFIEEYDYYAMTLYIRWQVGKSWEDFSSLNYFIKSTVLGNGSLELIHILPGEEVWYYTDVEASPFWTKIRLPFEQFKTEGATLAENTRWTDQPWLQFAFDVPREALEEAFSTGKLVIDLALDNVYLE